MGIDTSTWILPDWLGVLSFIIALPALFLANRVRKKVRAAEDEIAANRLLREFDALVHHYARLQNAVALSDVGLARWAIHDWIQSARIVLGLLKLGIGGELGAELLPSIREGLTAAGTSEQGLMRGDILSGALVAFWPPAVQLLDDQAHLAMSISTRSTLGGGRS